MSEEEGIALSLCRFPGLFRRLRPRGERDRSSCFVRGLALFLLSAGLWAQAPAPGIPNDCGHPYWKETLRCQALAVLPGTDLPQPNLDDRPANAGQLKEYTRVFLRDRNVRCLDGTRPVLYVAPGRCASPGGCPQEDGTVAPYGAPIHSDDWLITFTGGGACHARDVDGDGVREDGRSCTDVYPTERGEMGTATEPPMKNLGGPGGSSGIMSRDPDKNPVFATDNSVRVEKCSYDRYNGRAEHGGVEGSLGAYNFRYTLFNHGQLIAEAAIDELMNGLSYLTWADADNDGQVEDARASLPPLSEARRVLLVGHSGAAHGLRHNADRLAERIRKHRDTVDVRLLLDANFLPSVEGEAAYATGSSGDAYTDQWQGDSTSDTGPFSYDGEAYHRDGVIAEQLDSWETALDESCLAAHTRETQWKCRDRQHVLFNHISTPMFIREDLFDPNFEHTDGGNGHPISWALLSGCSYQAGLPALGCDARFKVLTEHVPRLLDLATTLLRDVGIRSEIARGVDRSLGGGTAPTVYLWMPGCSSHDGAYSNDSFFQTAITDGVSPLSMSQALEGFMEMPRLGAADWRIHGTVLGVTMNGACTP